MAPRSALGRAAGLARLLARRHEAVYWTHPHNREALRRLQEVEADVVIANDFQALPLAVALDGRWSSTRTSSLPPSRRSPLPGER